MTFLAITNDRGSRWTSNLTQQYLTQDNPDLNGWLPEKGGILYSADMTVFYQTFFKNPNADWRYILGYEPGFMSDEDFSVYHNIMWNFGDAKAYEPWVKKMRPQDRLVIRGSRGSLPNNSAIGMGVWRQRHLDWTLAAHQRAAARTDHSRNGDPRHFNQSGEFSEVTARRTFAPAQNPFPSNRPRRAL